jgi:hypothetical protein
VPPFHTGIPLTRPMKIVPVVSTLFLFSTGLGFAAVLDSAASCYNSTARILEAQLADPPTKDFTICPATTLSIGIPMSLALTGFTGGDIPLTVIHDDVTIQCGDDGDPQNNCRLSGGFIRFLTIPNHPLVPDRNVTTNNLRLKGLTFTGEMSTVFGWSVGPVVLSAPGNNMVLEDCIFQDLSSEQGVTAVTNDLATWITPAELYPLFSSELTIKGCRFHNVVYGLMVIGNYYQTMRIESATFSEMMYQDFGSGSLGVVANMGGIMTLSESTFDASQVASAAAHWSDDSSTNEVISTFDFRNNENRGIVFVNATDGEAYCEKGLLKQNRNKTFDCLDLFGEGDDTTSSAPASAPAGFSLRVALGVLSFGGAIFLGMVA